MTDDDILTRQALADRLAGERLKMGVQHLMGTRAGRGLAWHLLSQYGIFQEGFSANQLELARSSGRRAAGLQLLQLIDTFAPQQYAKMTSEAREDITNPMGESNT